MTYRNSFYNAKYQDSRPDITTDAKPEHYEGYMIHRRSKDVFDIVKDGVCIGMSAGLNGAKRKIDTLQ